MGAQWAEPRPQRRMPTATEVKRQEDIRAPGIASPVGRATGTRAAAVSATAARGVAPAASAVGTRLAAQATGALGGTASGALVALGPVGIAIGAVALGLTMVAKAASAVVNKFKEMSNTLGQYSASITLAQVKNEIAQTLQDVKRARTLGPQLGRFETERGRIDRAFERIGDKILEPILNAIVPAMEGMAKGIEAVDKNSSSIAVGIKGALLSNLFTAPMVPLWEIARLTGEANKLREQEKTNDLQKRFRELGTLENEVLDGRKLAANDLAPLQIGAVL